MCRIRGRRIYPSTLSERRVLLSLAAYPFYVPRGVSPFLIARKISRVALGQYPDLVFLREVAARRGRKPQTPEIPQASGHGDAAPSAA
jgi:hypothetical protein